MAKKVGVLNLEKALKDVLAEYGNEVYTVAEYAVDQTAKECVDKLKAVKKFNPGRNPSGLYSSSWMTTVIPSARLKVKRVVHNEQWYRLTHLLEKGHVSRNGTGRTFPPVKAYPHIAPVNDWAADRVRELVRSAFE